MEREQFKVLVKAMKAVYAQPTFIPDQDAFNVWFALLGDLPYKQAELAVQKHMATEKFPPTIADIREKAEQITSVKETEMSELEAWAIAAGFSCIAFSVFGFLALGFLTGSSTASSTAFSAGFSDSTACSGKRSLSDVFLLENSLCHYLIENPFVISVKYFLDGS